MSLCHFWKVNSYSRLFLKMNITDRFIEGLVEKSRTIPETVMQKVRHCLLDYLGVTAGGVRFIEERHPELLDASMDGVFSRAFAAHVLELDDGHRQGMIHLGASVITAVLSVAEKAELPSRNVILGIASGYEAAVRCARAIQPGHKIRGYHVSGTCGTIGSAIGVAFARGYNKEQLKSTLSCAVSSAAGVLEIQEQASELKPYNLGRAAFDGLLAANIGVLAMPGPEDILGGERGFLAAMTDTPNPEFLTDFSGEGFCIEGIYQKVHAACRHSHPAIDATLHIRNEVNLRPEQVERIEVRTYKLAVGSHDHTEIRGISSAKLSTPFAVSLAIVRGCAGYADYNEKNLNDCRIINLVSKVKVTEDKNFTEQSPAVRGARVIIFLKSGDVLEYSCLYPKGEPENPLSQQELEDKFRGLAMYGGLAPAECDEVIEELRKDNFDLGKIMKTVCK